MDQPQSLPPQRREQGAAGAGSARRRWGVAALAGLLLAAAAAAVLGQAAPTPAAPAAPPTTAAAPSPGSPASSPQAAADTGPVAVPEPSSEALRYYRSGNVLWWVNTIWGLLIPALFLFTGFAARLRDAARKVGHRWFFVLAVFFALYVLITFVLGWPLSYYEGFVRQHAYGLSNQTFGRWMGDSFKGLAVGLVAGFAFLWIPYLLLRKSPRRWWLWSGLAAVPVLFFVMLVGPIWVAPLFNHFGPMKDKALEGRILDLAHRAGIEAHRVYEVDMSVDTNTVNAYVAGLGGTKRIVLWDTLLARLTPRETLFVMGHEMGHYVLGHVVKGVFFFSGLLLVAFLLVDRGGKWLLARYGDRFGFHDLADVASLPLLLLLLQLSFLVLGPVALAYSRHTEHEADRFGLELTRDNHDAAAAFVALQEQNLGNPRPGLLYRLWRSSHPPLGERIEFANRYHPWKDGEPLRYAKHFRRDGGG